MSMLAKIFADDVRHLTSNIVSIIITIGLIVIPGLFTWFNVAACWDPFANTKNLQFAIANDDEGYKGDLLPMRINIGEQVVDTLRANSQLDWTFTKSSAEAIDGTKSGKYYAAVVIPKNFSKNMMTFFTDDAYHATLDYYNNEKLNALAPKVTGQGADTIAATINQTFSKTLTDTALNLASSMLDMLDKPEYQQRLKSFNGNIADLAGMLNDSAAVLRTYSSLTDSAKTLLASSNKLIADARASAKTGVDDLSAAKTGVSDLSGALGRLMALPEPPTAVVVGNDWGAFGLLRACRTCGMRVPEDLSIIGMDDSGNLPTLVTPTLASVAMPFDQVAYFASCTLCDLMEGVGTHQRNVSSIVQIAGELKKRDSIRPESV